MNNNVVQLVANAKSIVIVITKTAKLDSMAAGLGLYLALVSQGKSVKICSEASINNLEKLVGANNLSKTLDLGGNVLKVSFPYADGAIDKVTYNITDERFNLLIEPRVGNPPLQNKDVLFGYTGANIDLIFAIDAPNLEALGDIYLENPDVFERDKVINIDRRFDNQQYGIENLVEKQFSSTSEIVVKLLESLRFDLNPDIATNLYTGLVASTNNFTSFSTNAQSFEVASFLLKNGARKIPMMSERPNLTNMPDMQSGFQAKAPVRNEEVDLGSQNIFKNPFSKVNKGAAITSDPKPLETKKKQPPQDWLKPKIFKSTDSI